MSPAIKAKGFRVWTDWSTAKSFRRRIGQALRATDRADEVEYGLNSWLRSGVLRSDIVVLLLPAGAFSDVFYELRESDAGKLFFDIYARGVTPLRLYRDLSCEFYFRHPLQLWLNEYYREKVGYPLGKDPRESWQNWEARAARAMGLPTIIGVYAQTETEDLEAFIAEGITASPTYNDYHRSIDLSNVYLIRLSSAKQDIEQRLVPAVVQASQDKAAFERARKWKLQFRAARFTGLFWAVLTPVIVLWKAWRDERRDARSKDKDLNRLS